MSRGDSRHAIGFTFGGFFPTREDARDDARYDSRGPRRSWRSTSTTSSNVTFGGEYLFGLSDFLEGGRRRRLLPEDGARASTPHFVNTNGSEIAQDLKLQDRADHRDGPLPARWAAARRSSPTSAAASASSTGAIRRSATSSIQRQQRLLEPLRPFVADGTSVGPWSCGGVRFPIGDALTHRRRGALAEGHRRHRRPRRRLPRRQDRSRRHDGEFHDSFPLLNWRSGYRLTLMV